MPWWVALGLAAYTTHALWQGASLIKQRRLSGFVFVPLLLVKLGVIAVAAAYWHPDFCSWFKSQHWHGAWLVVPALCAYWEAYLMWHLVNAEIDQLKTHEWFYVGASVQVLVSAVLPAGLLFIAYLVLGLNRCAAA